MGCVMYIFDNLEEVSFYYLCSLICINEEKCLVTIASLLDGVNIFKIPLYDRFLIF